MGMDLQMLPIESERPLFSHTVLNTDRDYEFYEKIKQAEDRFGVDVPDGLMTYVSQNCPGGNTCYGERTTTAYGDRMKYVHVSQIWPYAAVRDLSRQNRAVLQYIFALPGDRKIALFWH